ncbi:MAG: spore cortex biosynthesis protein YabQ [Clostridia bacterium]|nr:spore cortex biosynthesis protein YabQ [Clostridia bacterium]
MIISDVVFQGDFFAAALFCGLLCGLIYDVFYIVRYIFKCGRALTFMLDLLFFVFSVLCVFVVFYPLNGFDIKWYIILGFIGGFCIEKYSFQKPIDFTAKKIYNGITCLKKYLAKRKGSNKNDRKTASSKS